MIFGLPGDGVDGMFEALRTHQGKLKFVQVRHEGAAAFAACGYAKYSGRHRRGNDGACVRQPEVKGKRGGYVSTSRTAAIHTGHMGDYVAFLTFGVAAVGLALGLLIRVFCK